MSTEIKSTMADGAFQIEQSVVHDGGLFVTTAWRDGGVHLDRADFIAAVETECDGIFIPRAELPEVEVGENGTYTVGGKIGYVREDNRTHTDYGHRAEGLRRLALAEHLKAHPLVDEARVHELAMALVSDPAIVGHRATFATDAIARRLVEQGWSK